MFDPTIDATNWRAEQAIRPAIVTRKRLHLTDEGQVRLQLRHPWRDGGGSARRPRACQPRRDIVSEKLAYGGKSAPYGLLVFDVELIKIGQ